MALQAISGALFELTNLFYVPMVLMLQLDVEGLAPRVCGLLLVVAYSLFRVLACSALCLLGASDFACFSAPQPSASLAAATGLLCFSGLTCMSWYWYLADILPAFHRGVQEVVGETYYHSCCPACVRRFFWRHCTADGRSWLRGMEDQRQTLIALRKEREEIFAAAEDSGDE